MGTFVNVQFRGNYTITISNESKQSDMKLPTKDNTYFAENQLIGFASKEQSSVKS